MKFEPGQEVICIQTEGMERDRRLGKKVYLELNKIYTIGHWKSTTIISTWADSVPIKDFNNGGFMAVRFKGYKIKKLKLSNYF